ncbi:MAG: sigma-54-dependent Fis family transcriptional regulator [Candidatus Krumholzibacteria bacterium]|nr:sigma-54-dependent Fis family transcriptional regulator [Candidatus Krumholzibacteria bacterium]
MNPEIWALVEREEVTEILEELASEENLHLRTLVSVSEALGMEEPQGGIILVIDSSGEHSNHAALIKRFTRTFIQFDAIVFGPRKENNDDGAERRAGVDLYVPVPVDREDFFVRPINLIALRRMKCAAGIVGRSEPLNEMLEMAMQVAPTEVSVLIEGESGSGKELTAKVLHMMSRRSTKPFEAVNVGALAEGVLESELFGHEKGAFTGAVARRRGLFERADTGTLLLDEVGEMSLGMQVKLLRVLETGEFLRVGGMERLHADVRLIAATNRELETAVEQGVFRKDLYYRLKVVQIRIPPLRARQEDIPFLVRYFLRRSAARHGKTIKGIDRKGMEMLVRYPWPGNVRELANMVDNLIVLSRNPVIKAEEIEKRLHERLGRESQAFPDLPIHVQKTREEVERELIINSLLSLHNDVREILHVLRERPGQGGAPGRWDTWVEVEEAGDDQHPDMNSIEKEAIREALSRNGGNRRRAARQLGMSERTLYRRLKEYGLA